MLLTVGVAVAAAANVAIFVRKEEDGFLFRQAGDPTLYGEAALPMAWGEDHYPPGDLAAAREILEREEGLSGEEPTRERIERVGAFLLRKLAPHRGTPSAGMDARPPLAQYRAALAGEDEVWCTNVRAIYVLFATAAGVPTRMLNAAIDDEGRGHSFAESYVAETGRWAFVDLQSSKLWVSDGEGLLQSAASLFTLHRAGGRGDHLRACVGLRPTLVPYPQVSSSEQAYFTANSRLLYLYPYADPNAFGCKAYRYAVRPDLERAESPSQARHLLKLALFWGGLATGLLWCALGARLLRAKKLATHG